jgi:DNA invertase Pin-like site-specific DNA recombinase
MENKMISVGIIAIYARASGPRADASLIAQTDACRRLASMLGCAEPEYFIDRDTTGNERGIELSRLLTVTTEVRFDAVVTASRDRLSSDPVELDRILSRLSKCGVPIHFLRDKSHFSIDPI